LEELLNLLDELYKGVYFISMCKSYILFFGR